MKLSRRKFFEAAFGMGQMALLSRFAPRSAFAAPTPKATKMLAIWLDGGCHWESFFSPFTSAGITKYMKLPTGGAIPEGYLPAQVGNFDRTSADLDSPDVRRKLRGPILWNWDKPSDTTGTNPLSGGSQIYRPYGYSWANPTYKIYDRIAVLVGADQGTAAHTSGIVASMCGIAGANFRAPAVQAVIANAMAERYPDRPIPNVSLGGLSPSSLSLPAVSSPVVLGSDASVIPTLSDRRDNSWLGLRTRTQLPDVAFDGSALPGTVPSTKVDEALLAATRQYRGASSEGSDALFERLYDTYKNASRTVARDVVSILGNVKGFEHLQADPAYPINWTACVGYADTCGPGGSTGSYEFALRLLKSNLVSTVTMRATSIANFSFDTHFSAGTQQGANHLRIALEQVGRMLIEMSLTPVSGGGSLLDETIVYVFSDFGRTFPKNGSDHHPATCAILAGGPIIGNQMIGGYDERMGGSPLGVPVSIREEGENDTTRLPRAQDVAATVLGSFGLESGKDFFIPGGYGIVNGVVG